MKLTSKLWQFHIYFEDSNIHTIYCENREFFRLAIRSLISEMTDDEGCFSLFDYKDNYPLHKSAQMIIDIFNLNINNKSFYTKINKEIKNIALLDHSNMQDIINRINSYFEEFVDKVDFPIIINKEVDIDKLLKIIDYKILASSDNDFFDNIITYMELCVECLNTKLFIFVNLKKYLTEDEISILFENFINKDYKIIILESSSKEEEEEKQIANPGELLYIIDNDLCEL